MKTNYLSAMLCIFILLSSNKSHAQSEIEIDPNGRSYVQIFDSLSTGLIPSRIPYGNLYSRVYGWSRLENWNQNDTVSTSQILQAWFDAENSVINPLSRPSRYEGVRQSNDLLSSKNELPILLLQYQFSFFDTLALQDGRLTVATNG